MKGLHEYGRSLLAIWISNTYKKNVPGKEFLCYELELYFRYLDIIDENNRYFYNSEETLEYKLNEK